MVVACFNEPERQIKIQSVEHAVKLTSNKRFCYYLTDFKVPMKWKIIAADLRGFSK